ncbi:MAG: hydantoinase/oxoprolinase family protein, partial [Thermomicrobiales bacterium]
GETIGLSLLETAWGIHEVVNEQMAGAARMQAIEQGKDPREYPIFAFGGAGPGHAYRVAEILRSPELVVPLGAGVTSTVGFLAAPLAFDFVRSYVGRLEDLDWTHVNARFREMEAEGRSILTAAGAVDADISVRRTVELRYVGQGHQVAVDAPDGPLGDTSVGHLTSRFESEYRRLYGRIAEGNPVEAINWRVVTATSAPHLPLTDLAKGAVSGAVSDAVKGHRPIYLPEHRALVDAPVYDRYRLAVGAAFDGPAVIEERESTFIVGPGVRISVDDMLNLVVKMPLR